jgi:aminopeptidase
MQQLYARFILTRALRLTPGQTLHLVRAPWDAADFVALLAEAARDSGAAEVKIYWEDDGRRIDMVNRGDFSGAAVLPPDDVNALVEGAMRGDAFVLFDCTCAGIFDGMKGDAVLKLVMEEGTVLAPLWSLISRNQAKWTMITAPTTLWAKKMYPDRPPEEGEGLLWNDIFSRCGIDAKDPDFEVWDRHVLFLEKAAEVLNGARFSAVRFTAPGTDLTVGLADGHRWLGPAFRTPAGLSFTPNIPMDEIFTSPHRLRVNGTVRSTRPVVVNGLVIEDIDLVFRQGRVVESSAGKGGNLLDAILQADEGSCRLGETALVPLEAGNEDRRPLYYTTLFDENASSHLALGRTYAVTVVGDLEDDAFLSAGGNRSALHIDFTIGSGLLDADGITKDGKRTAILRGSRWVLESGPGVS